MTVSPILNAAIWMIGALASFILMAVAGRELSTQYGTFEILFFRSLIGVMILIVLMSRMGFHHMKPRNLKIHGIRNIVHFFGQAGWFYGLAFIPLASVFAIEFTTPIWTAIAAMLLLGEKLTKSRAIAIAFGFTGIVLILRPGFEIIELAAFAVLGAAVAYAITHTMTKKLIPTNSILTIIFYMSLIQLPMALGFAMIDWVPPVWSSAPWFILVGATGLSAHLCLTKALGLADATVVVPMDFMRLPLIAVVGYFLYNEAIEPWLFAGAGFIFIGIYINIAMEKRKNQSINLSSSPSASKSGTTST